MITLTLKRDSNGNKVLQVKPDTGRAFSIQTLGNLPTAHSQLAIYPDSGVIRLDQEGVKFTHVDAGQHYYAAAAVASLCTLAWREVQRHVKHSGTARQKAMLAIE